MLTCLGRGQLITTDFVEGREIVVRKRSQDLGDDAFIVVAQHIADPGYLAPRDL